MDARGYDARMVEETVIMLPDAPILVTSTTRFAVLSPDGEMSDGPVGGAAQYLLPEAPPIVCHMPATTRRANKPPFPGFDLLELFAFVRPAQFCLPTPRGLADACGIERPNTLTDEPMALYRVAGCLLREFSQLEATPDMRRLLWGMAKGGWPWGALLLRMLGEQPDDGIRAATSGLDVWKQLPEWEEKSPPPPPGSKPVQAQEARRRLAELLGGGAEERPSQADYASAVTGAFANPVHEDSPNIVLAEAGTGVGKTLGYIAPASLWAEMNEAPVWLSTYTRNLQHQIDQELDRLYPNPKVKRDKVVLRKGRENYLCLLNYEDAVRGIGIPGRAVALGLMARWIAHTRDGDMSGGDFPSWLSDLVGIPYTTGLSDRRGECIYAACSHYTRCFVENSVRRARRADLVVANHALVMIQAARGGLGGGERAARLVFDEGHHVFDAADSAFSAHITGVEMWELRRWLRGHDTRAKGRARGLKARCEDLLGGSEDAVTALEELLQAATALAGEGWRQRLADNRPSGPGEAFLAAVRTVILNRATGIDGPYGLEVDVTDLPEDLLSAADDLFDALGAMQEPAGRLQVALLKRLDDEADSLDSGVRSRIDIICRSLEFRCKVTIAAWRDMLRAFKEEPQKLFVDWFGMERYDGRELDVGYLRHWVDPTMPFADTMADCAQGVLVTSATLTDGSGDVEKDWRAAEFRTGAAHLLAPAVRARVPSPFDYPKQTRVYVVTDVRKDDLDQVAAAYRELMLASHGGALGLFTAISRLREVHRRIAGRMDEAGLPLYAQHVDAWNLPTLIDIFRAEENSCLLGTDAVRDGVDVPGNSLRMIVFDRVPWPRRTILHRARRDRFGKGYYDDVLIRLKLKQAFGRLVRRKNDRGVFVMLDPMMPSRLGRAFPEGVEVQRVGLAEAVAATRAFFAEEADQPGT